MRSGIQSLTYLLLERPIITTFLLFSLAFLFLRITQSSKFFIAYAGSYVILASSIIAVFDELDAALATLLVGLVCLTVIFIFDFQCIQKGYHVNFSLILTWLVFCIFVIFFITISSRLLEGFFAIVDSGIITISEKLPNGTLFSVKVPSARISGVLKVFCYMSFVHIVSYFFAKVFFNEEPSSVSRFDDNSSNPKSKMF